MVRKKGTRQTDNLKRENPQAQVQHCTQSQQPIAIDEHLPDKLQSLKNLNVMLLKETSERRQQVNSLLDSKEALESALNCSVFENNVLENKFSKAIEDSVGLELEKCVVVVYMENQIKEIGLLFDKLAGQKREIECVESEREAEILILKGEVKKLTTSLENERHEMNRVNRENDQVKEDFDGLVVEANQLREKLIGLENTERKLTKEVQKLKMEGEQLIGEKLEKEREVEELKGEVNELIASLENERDEMNRLKKEKDKVKEDFDGLVVEKNHLREKFIGLENIEKKLTEEVKKLKIEGEQLMGEKFKKERAVEELKGEVNKLTVSLVNEWQEMNRVNREKDEVKENFDGLVAETNQLRKKLIRLENKDRMFTEEVKKLKMECELLMGEKLEKERTVEELRGVVNKLIVSLENERHEINRVNREKDNVKKDFYGLVIEANQLREKLTRLENIEIKLIKEVKKLKMEGEQLMGKKLKKEIAIKSLIVERDLAQRNLAESTRLIVKLKNEVDGILREKNETERQKTAQEQQIIGLTSELNQLNETVKNLRIEEGSKRSIILNMENSLNQALKKEKDMSMEIGVLVIEKKENEQIVQMLTNRIGDLQRDLKTKLKDLSDKQRMIDETIQNKNEIEHVKICQENEIIELQKEMDQLKVSMQNISESCRDFEEENKQLALEVYRYKNAIAKMTVERDHLKMGFDEEQRKVENLMLQVADTNGKIEQTTTALGQMRSEREKLIEENKFMGSRMNTLMNENDVMRKSLLVAQQKFDDLRAKIEFSNSNLNQALAMLKSTTIIVYTS